MHYMHTHTFEQRRQNWIIKNISRPSGLIIDYVYHHLDTNKKFRSLIEVYKFLVYGEVPEITKKLRENEEPSQVRRKPHGKKLVNKYVVGTCTEPCSGIYIKNRGEVNYLSERDIPSNIEKKRKRGNEDLYGHQQVNLGDNATHVNSGDVALSTTVHSFLYLWDFKLIPEARNENLS
uniref:MBD domain-containing protein n=2 Tax=Solanum lycopersicum TaxID=4081 RepID=A0A3Q7HI96_SOLLC